MDPRLIELFLLGAENALLDAGQLGSLGIEDGATLFMLQRQSAFLQLRSCVSATCRTYCPVDLLSACSRLRARGRMFRCYTPDNAPSSLLPELTSCTTCFAAAACH